jgi:hypothetical protein
MGWGATGPAQTETESIRPNSTPCRTRDYRTVGRAIQDKALHQALGVPQHGEPTMRLTWAPEKKLHARLARNGIRIFKLHIVGSYGCEDCVLIHANKTTEEWRRDVREFLQSERNSLREKSGAGTDAATSMDGESTLPSRLYHYLHSRGYCDIDDVVSDVYEGRVAVLQSHIVDDPEHEEQETGFGHYGWDSKRAEEPGGDQHGHCR